MGDNVHAGRNPVLRAVSRMLLLMSVSLDGWREAGLGRYSSRERMGRGGMA